MDVSVIGVGVMGEPIAKNLLKAGMRVTVSNRSTARCEPLRQAGAAVAPTAREAIVASDVCILMVPSHHEIDEVMGRSSDGRISAPVRGRIIVNMATVSPSYSEALSTEIAAAGGSYVEAPVSGSRKPAETGQLVILAASADETIIDHLGPLFSAVGRMTLRCGKPPNGMRMKLANNLLLIALFEAVTEATHFARGIGLDLEQFMGMVLAGPLANDVVRMKAPKLLAGDFTQQAPIKNVAKDIRLICEEARRAGIWTPVAMTNAELFTRAMESGLAEDDAIGVLKILQRPQ
jgi:3-hydroxyisobutyrate dehydrogenase